jgi:hypothetical protein
MRTNGGRVKKSILLKNWMTVPEAAEILSNSLKCEVTEADLLQYACDKHLKLSVNIVNSAKVRRTKAVPWEDTEWLLFPTKGNKNPFSPETSLGNSKCPPILEALWKKVPEDKREFVIPFLISRKIDDNRFLIHDQQITEISGICDLPMIGAELRDVEHQYSLLTDGPVVEGAA